MNFLELIELMIFVDPKILFNTQLFCFTCTILIIWNIFHLKRTVARAAATPNNNDVLNNLILKSLTSSIA